MFTQNEGAGQKAWVQSATYFSGDDYYEKGEATMTLTANYNNDTNRAITGASGQVMGDYGKVADPVNMVVTGKYISTLVVNIQPSSDTIIPTTVAGNDFTAILTSQGTVWAWGTNEYGQLGQGLPVKTGSSWVGAGSTGIASAAENLSLIHI